MYQYDDPTAVAVQPASTPAGTAGYFTDGNPATNSPATVLRAEFLNAIMLEFLNVLVAAGIQPNKAAFNQLVQAINVLAGGGSQYAIDTSTAANAIVATLTPAPSSYTDGMFIRVDPANANTGAVTIDLNGLGVKSLLSPTGGALLPGAIQPGQIFTAIYTAAGEFQVLDLNSTPGIYAVDTGAVNNMVGTVTPPVGAYEPGYLVLVKPAFANTGAVMLALNGLAAKSVVRPDGNLLQEGDLAAGIVVPMVYTAAGTFQLINWPGRGGLTANNPVRTGNFNIVAGNFEFIDTSGGPVTATLPANPNPGDLVVAIDKKRKFATNNFTWGHNGNPIMGLAEDMVVSNNGWTTALRFSDSTDGWLLIWPS